MSGATRREALTGLATALAVAAVPTAALAASHATVDRSKWNGAMERYRRAKAKNEAFNPVFDRIYDAVRAETDALPAIEIPANLYIGLYPAITSKSDSFKHYAKQARRKVEEFEAGKVQPGKHVKAAYGENIAACRKLVAIDDERTAQIKAIEARHGYKAAEERWEALGEAAYDAEWAVMDIPAPDHAALLWKLEKLLEIENDGSVSSWSASAIEQTVSDMRRLLSNGRA